MSKGKYAWYSYVGPMVSCYKENYDTFQTAGYCKAASSRNAQRRFERWIDEFENIGRYITNEDWIKHSVMFSTEKEAKEWANRR